MGMVITFSAIVFSLSVAAPAQAANHWIGVGTTTPRAALDVITPLTPQGSAIIVPLGTTGAIPTPVDGMIRYNTDAPAHFEFYGNGAWTPLGGNQWTTVGNDLYNTLAGNVGIGAAADPVERLQITGGNVLVDNNSKFIIGSLGSLQPDSATTGIALESNGALRFRTSGIDQVIVTTGGNVGIGSTSPTTALDVGNGTITAQDIILHSDQRLKKDIESLGGEDSLNKVCRLNPVSFAWKSNGHPDLGVIAQELQAIYPELVVEAPNGSLSVRYTSLIAPILAATHELNRRQQKLADENADLRARVGKLEGDNKAILSELQAIRARLDAGN